MGRLLRLEVCVEVLEELMDAILLSVLREGWQNSEVQTHDDYCALLVHSSLQTDPGRELGRTTSGGSYERLPKNNRYASLHST